MLPVSLLDPKSPSILDTVYLSVLVRSYHHRRPVLVHHLSLRQRRPVDVNDPERGRHVRLRSDVTPDVGVTVADRSVALIAGDDWSVWIRHRSNRKESRHRIDNSVSDRSGLLPPPPHPTSSSVPLRNWNFFSWMLRRRRSNFDVLKALREINPILLCALFWKL